VLSQHLALKTTVFEIKPCSQLSFCKYMLYNTNNIRITTELYFIIKQPVGFIKPTTLTHENPHPWLWVRVLTGMGEGYPGKPQGSP
jgi:hypothetical protein